MNVEGQEFNAALRNALLELRLELSVNTHRVAMLSGLNDSDLDVLDVLSREGPLSPTTLAKRTGIHPATMTGVLARLEAAEWVLRRRADTDRRSVQIEYTGFERLNDIYRSANARLDAIAADLPPETGTAVLNYLREVSSAVRQASTDLDSSTAELTPKGR